MKIGTGFDADKTGHTQVHNMATEPRERLISKAEWKFIGFLALAIVLTPVFYGLSLLSPLFALGTSLRSQ